MMKQTMKQLSGIALMAILGGTLATSCSSEDFPNTSKQSDIITINAGFPISNTRMNYTEDAGTMKTTWAEDDAFVISSNPWDESTAKVFTIKAEDANKATAAFEGTAPAAGASLYYVFYPATIKTATAFFAHSYLGQEQDANNPKGHLKSFHSMMKGVPDYHSISFREEDENDFRQSGIIKLNLSNLPEAIIPTKVSLTTSSTSFRSHFAGTNMQGKGESPTVELVLKNYSSTKEITAYLVISILGVDLEANSTLTITVESTSKTYTKVLNITNATPLGSGKLHSITASDGWQEKTN